ncbi:MAG: acyl-protein synthetase [Clostridiales bacterium]|jgi:phenylacetate-coenzyme A ligase PaaK-like adenylate-forming protein|nr:acyl-protein synthetase [Clostridiales bacterium]
MKYRRKLFATSRIYDLPRSDGIFLNAMKESIEFHMRKCSEYKEILDNFDFDIHALKEIDDLAKIPPLPTSYLKNNTLISKPYEKLLIKTTSSGTSGKKTFSGLDKSSAICFGSMALRILWFHGLISRRLTNYIILGYKPDKLHQAAMAKALKSFTLLAPAKKIEYALKHKDGKFDIDIEDVVNTAVQFGRQNRPLRIVGFPAYFKMFLDELIKRDIKINLHRHSKILLGGGWKALHSEEISKDALFEMANDVLGIRKNNFKDHFSTAEHPVNYVACENNNYHVPIFGRVLIRDVNTLEPVPFGTPGLLNLISPVLSSMPYGSIMTDDIAILKDGKECGCGVVSPYFSLIGRVGLANIKTCVQTI